MGFHFIFSIMWYWYFVKSNFLSTRRQMKIRVVTMSLFYGILIEALQHLLTDTRQADVWDLAANIVGSVLAIAVLTALEKILSSRKI
ncbi:MAG: VanZ family protein [Flavobacterium sp.]|nr:VanZ family protein [Flavobacterium sp.]